MRAVLYTELALRLTPKKRIGLGLRILVITSRPMNSIETADSSYVLSAS